MKFLGTVKNGSSTKDLYAKWDGEQVKYIVEGFEVAVYDPDVMEEPILFMNNTKANELSAETKDAIQQFAENVDVEELKSMATRYDESKQEEIADTLGLEKEQVGSLTEVDLRQKVRVKKESAKEESKRRKKLDDLQHEKEKLYTTKDINIKQELKLNVMATDMKTVEQVLKRAGKMPNVNGKTFTKLGIVESTDMKSIEGKINSTRFSFVAIAQDGTVVPLNLEQDRQEGRNPREISYQTRGDGSIEQDDVLSRYKIGDSGETFSVKKATGAGYIEVSYSPTKTLGSNGVEGNVSMDQQLETSTVYWKTRKEIRQSEYRGYEQADDKYIEAVKEGKTDITGMKRGQKGVVTNATYKETDGRQDTKSHEHEEGEEYEGRVPWDGMGRTRY